MLSKLFPCLLRVRFHGPSKEVEIIMVIFCEETEVLRDKGSYPGPRAYKWQHWDSPQVCLWLDREHGNFAGHFPPRNVFPLSLSFIIASRHLLASSPPRSHSPLAAAHGHGHFLCPQLRGQTGVCSCRHWPILCSGALCLPCHDGFGNKSGGSRGSPGIREGDVINYGFS